MLRHPSLKHLDHRPYPLPRRPWAMGMTWRDLLFMHWPVDPAVMRAAVPGDFDLDVFEGACWVGVVPFYMTGIRPRLLPAVPRWVGEPSVSRFAELNVRTYVSVSGVPGVLFFSLDAENKWAVRAARFDGFGPVPGFGLPYMDAAMHFEGEAKLGDNAADGWVRYASQRTHFGAPPASFKASYRPIPGAGPVTAAPGTLEHFLTERYCLYSLARRGRVMRGHIHHAPWPLEPAECEMEVCEMTGGLGFALPVWDRPRLHFARKLDVIAWLPERVD